MHPKAPLVLVLFPNLPQALDLGMGRVVEEGGVLYRQDERMCFQALDRALAMGCENLGRRDLTVRHKVIGGLGIGPSLTRLSDRHGGVLRKGLRDDLTAAIQPNIVQGHAGKFGLGPRLFTSKKLYRHYVSLPISSEWLGSLPLHRGIEKMWVIDRFGILEISLVGSGEFGHSPSLPDP